MASIWTQKGATLSDKSTRKEFGLTQPEILAAVRAGKLQYRENHVHGNPYLRLLRHEVEALVKEQSGQDELQRKKLKKELSDLNTEARWLKARLKAIDDPLPPSVKLGRTTAGRPISSIQARASSTFRTVLPFGRSSPIRCIAC